MGSSRKSNNFLAQGTILAGASILVRLIGFVYRYIMGTILGTEGSGIYSIAFNIYNIILILSSYSLPLAVSRLIAARSASHQYKNANAIFRCALAAGAAAGGAAALFLYFGSGFLASLYSMPDAARPLKILAPTAFIVAVLGVFRGLYQGKNTMIPTAFSQILEQIVNAVVSIYAAYSLMEVHSLSENISSYGAAGGTMGTLAGALAALLFLSFLYSLYRPYLKRQEKRDRTGIRLSKKMIYKLLLATVVPVMISQTVYQISGTLDDAMFSNILHVKGVASQEKTALIGVYAFQYKLLLTLPISIATAFSASVIPSITASMEIKQYALVRQKVKRTVKLNMVIAFPCTIGFIVLAHPIMAVLFSQLPKYTELAGNILQIGSIAVIFFTLSAIASGILQGMNKMALPVKNSLISLAVHIPMVIILLMAFNLGVYGLVIGNITFPFLTAILNWRDVSRKLYYHQEFNRTYLRPFLASAIMGLEAFFVYKALFLLVKSAALALTAAIVLSIVVYFILVLKMKIFAKEELAGLPMGRKLLKLGRKLGAIS